VEGGEEIIPTLSLSHTDVVLWMTAIATASLETLLEGREEERRAI